MKVNFKANIKACINTNIESNSEENLKTNLKSNLKSNLELNLVENIKTISLNKRDIHKGNLILVNKKFPLFQHNKNDVNFVPASDINSEILLAAIAANMFEQLMKTCNVGNQIVPISGYRTLTEQEQIFSDSMRENGEEFTLKFVALPNQSEHQTGLAIDVAENMENIDFICPSFPYDGICQKFRMKAASYGFIERYPKGKEEITGISHEPWHFRYVGYPHSEIIQKNNFTLEEYINYIKAFTYDGMHLLFVNNNQKIEIYYVKADVEPLNPIILHDDVPYQISGNNSDGFIITIWRTS
ncbi:MAG: M15 family metallopeptidase [Ruminiclostridium sp.]